MGRSLEGVDTMQNEVGRAEGCWQKIGHKPDPDARIMEGRRSPGDDGRLGPF
jgi:hypothetical protein